MVRTYFFLFFLIFPWFFLGSCSSRPLRGLSGASSCYLKKHPSKDYYQIYSGDKLLFNNWYDEDYAQKLIKTALKRGRCR